VARKRSPAPLEFSPALGNYYALRGRGGESPDKSHYRTSPVLELYLSGLCVNREFAENAAIDFLPTFAPEENRIDM
jgi:hypothetical protein